MEVKCQRILMRMDDLTVYQHILQRLLDHTEREGVMIQCKRAAQQFGFVMNEGACLAVVALHRKCLLRQRGDVSYSWITSTLPPAHTFTYACQKQSC